MSEETSISLMMVNLSKAWGGGEKWFLTVGRELQKKGFRMVMVCYPDSALHKRLLKTNLAVETSSLRFLSLLHPSKLREGQAIIRRHAPDFLIMNASHELKTFGLLGKQLGVPHRIFRRGVSYALSDNWLNRWYMDKVATAFLANSRATFDAVTRAFPVFLNKSHLQLNNGINVSEWTPNPDAAAPFQLGMSARLSPEKGIDRAIEVMSKICKELPQARLHIYGTGPEEKSLKAMAHSLGMGEQVVFHGFVEDIQKALSACKLFLFTPRKGEGTSIALIEAMAMKLPCVAFDTAAMEEVIVDGETGYLIEDGNTEKMAQRVGEILQDEPLRVRMGEQGRKRAEGHFDLSGSVIDPLTQWIKEMYTNRHG